MRLNRRTLMAGAAASLALPARSQSPWPAGPQRLVVPFPPGGLLDTVGRLVGPALATQLGQPVVIDNRPGSGGNIGTDAVAKAAPDGNTWLLGSPGLAISPHLYPKLPWKLDDLVPVAMIGSQPNVLLVPAASPVRSAAELVAMLKRAPGRHDYASNGNGTSLHLSAELFKFRTGTFALHIPYRGSAQAMTALQAGDVAFMFDNLAPALPQIQAGRVRALAVTSPARSPALPGVPSLQEAGIGDIDVTAWFGLLLPRGTPPGVVQRLEQATLKALGDATLAQALQRLGIQPQPRAAAEFTRHLARESAQWREVVAYAKVVLE